MELSMLFRDTYLHRLSVADLESDEKLRRHGNHVTYFLTECAVFCRGATMP